MTTHPARRRGLLFDLDNTLILEDAATHEAVRAAANAVASRRAVDPARLADAAALAAERLWKAAPHYRYGEAFGIWWGEALWGGFNGDGDELALIRAFLPGFRKAVWRDALAGFGSRDGALADEMQDTYARTRRAKELIDPDAEAVLADVAHDHRLALLTNGAGDVQREKLSRTPLAHYFDVVVISVEVGIGKPDPGIFGIALERLGVAAADATMIGDSLLRDVAGAQRAGMRAIWVDRDLAHEDGPRPDARITRLGELRAALDALERRPASPPAMP